MLAPKEFEQELSKEQFVHGQTVAASKTSVLRYTFPMTLLAAALAVYGCNTLHAAAVQPQMVSYWVSGSLILLTGVAAAVLWLVELPRRVKAKAAADFALHHALYGHTTVRFTQDEMVLHGERLTHTVAFAKTRLCVETPTLFVVFTDEDAVVMLAKDAFADNGETVAFLRDVFARWYKKKG